MTEFSKLGVIVPEPLGEDGWGIRDGEGLLKIEVLFEVMIALKEIM